MGAKLIDETGNKYNKLTAIEPIRIKGQKVKWKCQCECGNFILVTGSDLRRGHITSCGCSKGEKLIKDLTGQTFGKLTALYYLKERDKNRYIVWHCRCDCGNEVDISSNSLLTGNTKSCGCYQREQTSNANLVDLTNQKFGLLTALYPVNKGSNESIVWHCKCDCGYEKDILRSSLKSGRILSCGCLSMSRGEFKIRQLLIENSIDFIQEYKPKDKEISFDARFDFYIPSLNTLIEYDGQQHFYTVNLFGGEDRFQTQIAHDKEKNEWAYNNGIQIIRIPYTHYDDLCLEDLLPETSSFLINKKIKYLSRKRD